MGRLGFCRLYGTNEAYLQRGIGMRVIWPDRESFIVERGCLGIERVCRIICRLSLKCLSTRSSNLFPPNKTCTTWEGGGRERKIFVSSSFRIIRFQVGTSPRLIFSNQ